jgi:hypothetical protein
MENLLREHGDDLPMPLTLLQGGNTASFTIFEKFLDGEVSLPFDRNTTFMYYRQNTQRIVVSTSHFPGFD